MGKRSTFTSSRNTASNEAYFARRDIRKQNERNNVLYNPNRKRSESELETMRRAALKNPHGRAAQMLANDMRIPIRPKDGVTVEDVAAVAPAGTKTK